MSAPLLLQGNCDEPPTAADVAVLEATPGAAGLLTVQATQCLIITHEDLFHSLSPGCDASFRLPRLFQAAPAPHLSAACPPLNFPPHCWNHSCGTPHFTLQSSATPGNGACMPYTAAKGLVVPVALHCMSAHPHHLTKACMHAPHPLRNSHHCLGDH